MHLIKQPRTLNMARMVLAFLAVVASSAHAQTQVPFEADIRKFEAQDAVNPPKHGGLVFVGSSSIVRWKTLQTDFPELNVINRGFGGSVISDSVRFADRIVTPYRPNMVVFFAGTNDIAAGKSANTVFQDYKAFVAKVHAKLPRTTIAYISITPAPSRWAKLEEVKKANRLIQEYVATHERLLFVNTFPEMLTKDGGPRPELFVEDQLHMSPLGYEIWVRAVRKILPNRNQEVIQAAMLSLFRRSDWNYFWTKGDYVMVYPQPSGQPGERSTFSTQLTWLVKWLEGEIASKVGNDRHQRRIWEAITALKQIDPTDGPESTSVLEDMQFDPRIVIGEDPRLFETEQGGPVKRPSLAKVKNREGRDGTVRATPRLGLPVFSKDGQHAILWTNAWDRSCDVIYVLESKGQKWQVSHAFTIGYL